MVNRCWTKDRNLTAPWQKTKHTMPLLSPAWLSEEDLEAPWFGSYRISGCDRVK